MSNYTETKEIWQCDLCGEKCTPVRWLKETTQFMPVESAGVEFKVQTFGLPVSTHDVCKVCCYKAIKSLAERLGNETNP